MRITLVNQFYKPDLAPTGHLAASLAEHRAELGDVVTVITSAGGYVPESRGQLTTDRRNPRIHRIWTPQLGKNTAVRRIADYTVFFTLALWRLLFIPAQDVIISLTTPPFIYLAALFHKALHPRTRVLIWIMDCYPEALEQTGAIRPGGLISTFMRTLNRLAFRRMDRIICLDKAMEQLIRSQYADRNASLNIELISNWEHAEDFPDGFAPARWEPADQLGLESNFVVLYLGNAGHGHRFETVIEAAQMLRDQPFIFLFVGGGEKWAWLEQAKLDNELQNLVLHRYVPKEMTPSVMAAADCGLITLSDEALGVISPSKLHGYLAMGLPVIYIGPEGGNVDEAIGKYKFGISLRHGDLAGLVEFLRELRRNALDRKLCGNRARKAFIGAFSGQASLTAFDYAIGSMTGHVRAG
jgi:glycosyltransferase involved in cell wall biosynthesis